MIFTTWIFGSWSKALYSLYKVPITNIYSFNKEFKKCWLILMTWPRLLFLAIKQKGQQQQHTTQTTTTKMATPMMIPTNFARLKIKINNFFKIIKIQVRRNPLSLLAYLTFFVDLVQFDFSAFSTGGGNKTHKNDYLLVHTFGNQKNPNIKYFPTNSSNPFPYFSIT